MDGDPERLERPRVEALDAILGRPFKVLDDGFIRVVDYMGSDASIVQAARVSYGAGTKKVHEDRGLIRYLMRHRHTTPFEMCELKLHVRVPMDCWRQWIRHRMACLAPGTEIHFDLPGGIRQESHQLYKLTIEEVWRRFQPALDGTRPDIRRLRLRQIDEDTLLVQRTRVVDVFKNGIGQVFRMLLDDGKSIECTADHRFLFADGWKSLREAAGLRRLNGKAIWDGGEHRLHVNGIELEAHAPSRDRRGGPPRRPLVRARCARIVGFESIGERETYDLEVEGPFHNFIANGIVTHNSVNEYSTRYSVAIDAAQRTGPGEWRLQAAGNRQGSAGFLDEGDGAVLTGKEDDLHRTSRAVYEERLKAGVAREQARKDLPLSTYTEAYWKIDLHNLLHFLALRMDDHAQEEIRAYARVIGHEIVGKWCPMAWEAFLDYRVDALALSRLEVEVIRALDAGQTAKALDLARSFGWLAEGPGGLKRNREREELARKLASLNLPVPWQEPAGRGEEG
jgi:flavin-dependent thymidylate synthase